MKLFSIAFLLTSLFSSYASAETDDVEKLKQALAKIMPQVAPSKISQSPVAGMYEVIVGTQVVYMSVDAKFMIEGDLINLATNENVSEGAKSAIRLAGMNKIGEENMIVYAPKEVKETITVITDIDCGYCRLLHSEIPNYLENNIAVRYIFKPVLGGEKDMEKTISVWCSDDQKSALDIAKAGGDIKRKVCKNPIEEHLKFSYESGARGTPAIVLEDGQLIAGYVRYDKLIAELRK
jgi:thiol:disulfide interchange protein DsbC